MDMKFWFAIMATMAGIVAFLPYLRDMLARKTRPHAYTWLIWVLTQGIAVAGILRGGGAWGALNLVAGLLFCILIFVLSFRYGTRDITRGDTSILLGVVGAILLWVVFDSPLLSVLFVTGIDMLGYVPSFRKSYADPWGETLSSWFLFALSDVFALFALSEYNLLTATYLVSITVANLALLLFCTYRRTKVSEA